ncbi:MAG: GntR family transcriptional regulator [Candidatus Dormibacteraceae bacterium]
MIVERWSLVEGAYETLKELILDQRVAPSEYLNIDALAPQMGISQTPIREALGRLEAEGYVVKLLPQRRYLVAPMLDLTAFEHLYEVRLLLEPRAASLAATRLSDVATTELERALSRMLAAGRGVAYRDYREFPAEDATFHHVIARESGNAILADAITRLRSHQQIARLYRKGGVDAVEGIAEHEALLQALRSGNAKLAERAMRTHIDGSHQRLREFVKNGSRL